VNMLEAGRADVTVASAPDFLPFVEAGSPVVALAGIHGGCYELFVNERVRAFRDLKGKRVAVIKEGYSPEYFYIASMMRTWGWIRGKTFNG